MKLIDADALKEYVKQEDYDSSYTICAYIDNAPTVETYTKDDMTREYLKGYNAGKDMNERPQGEWLYPDADIVIGKRRIGRSRRVCSVCKQSFSNNIPWDANFCPNCGAEIKTY